MLGYSGWLQLAIYMVATAVTIFLEYHIDAMEPYSPLSLVLKKCAGASESNVPSCSLCFISLLIRRDFWRNHLDCFFGVEVQRIAMRVILCGRHL